MTGWGEAGGNEARAVQAQRWVSLGWGLRVKETLQTGFGLGLWWVGEKARDGPGTGKYRLRSACCCCHLYRMNEKLKLRFGESLRAMQREEEELGSKAA